MWAFWNQAAISGDLACMALYLLVFLVTVGLFRGVCRLNLLVCLVLPPTLAPSILSLPPTRTRVWIPFLLIFTSSISTPYLNQGLYPHPAMTGVQLMRRWGSLWLWKKKMVVVVWGAVMAGIRGVTLVLQRSLSSLLEVAWAQLDETLMKGDSHLMTPMTCWSALLTGLYRDYRDQEVLY